MSERTKHYALEDKTKFVTFALDGVKLSTEHRKEKGKGKKVDDKAPRVLGPADTIIHAREEGPTVQRCGDSEVACKRTKGQYYLGQKYRGRFGRKKSRGKIVHDVKHIFREHNQDIFREHFSLYNGAGGP